MLAKLGYVLEHMTLVAPARRQRPEVPQEESVGMTSGDTQRAPTPSITSTTTVTSDRSNVDHGPVCAGHDPEAIGRLLQPGVGSIQDVVAVCRVVVERHEPIHTA